MNMQRQATVRQPDETICFRCGATVKRDAGSCPSCGSRIAAGPPHMGAQAMQPVEPVQPAFSAPTVVLVDEVGAGRYVLNFFLAGLIGIGLTYLMRNQGWSATWISAVIFVLGVAVIIATRA